MEPSEESSQINKDNFLEVPNLSDSLSEDEEVKATFKPGFSPQPSRRGSDSSEDMSLDIPPSGVRRVSFADTFGLNLVSVKEFDCWDLPSVLTNFDSRKDIFHPEEYVLSPLFDLPSSRELMQQLQEQKAILESAEYLPGSTSMKGIIRVLNISFEKLVYVRMSLDDWQTHYDILAEYVPNSCDGETDQFSFKISLVPPYQKDGSKIQFCIRYETSVGTFWSNNNGTNYILVCQKKEQELKPVKPWEDLANRQIKGCLKVKSSKEESSVTTYTNHFENSKITDTYIPTIVCSHEEKEDLEIGNQNVKDVNREHDELNEKELKLMVNQHLIKSPASKDEKSTFSTYTVNFPNKAEGFKKKHIYDEVYTDLLENTLSSSSSPESNLKRDFYHDENVLSGNDCSHHPSQNITSDIRKIKLPLTNIGSDELVKSHISIKEVLDDNANSDQRRGKVQISCSSSDQLMRDKLNKKHEGEAMKIKIKDLECLRRDLPSDFHLEESIEKASSMKDHGTGINEKEKHLGVNKKQSKNLQSMLHNQEKKMSHSEMNVKRIGARELTVLPSKDTTTPDQEIRTDLFQSPTGNLSLEEAVLTTPECDPLPSKGTTLGEMPGQVCSRNRIVLRNYHVYQGEEETSYWANTEDQNKNKPHKQLQNVLEGHEKTRKSKTNTTEQIKEQVDYEDMWKKRDNTMSLNVTPTELFTFQETVSCELSSLVDHDINEKVGVGTAYTIKTSESPLESMSATEKAVIAKLSQETAQNYRPIEVKETVFDPHEGRKDNSHYTFCQGDKVGVIYDNDFEKKTCLDIYNVHVGKVESEEMLPMYNPPKKCGIGNKSSVEESLQVISGNQRADSKLNFHLGMLPTDKKIFPKNRDHGQVQEFSKEMDVAAIINPALNSDPNRLFENGSHISNHHAKTSVSSYEQAVTIENTVTTMTLQSIPSKSEYNCNSSGTIQGIEKHLHPWDIPEEVSKTSGIMTVSRNEKSIGQIFQQRECNVKKYLRPMASITEDIENIEETRHKHEGLLNSGQSRCFSSDKESKSPTSANLHAQEYQAQSSRSLLLKYINSDISYFLLFLIFLVTIYQYDLMISLAFYLFLLYCLSWEGGRQKKSVRKK
ncbi:protein phosphatase 1 regulatory subunit 3A isoform X1 [Phyllostomus hastatus]|uniref:protein phosphatase 1 regulatory subunit 3A isoform X1 n=1 Tax=Phyllostomus hastatus TaxID=9423 RepID=UPI001E6814D8|nr:protein phosphatase 1 regulatory subunit 3A isoform X1 [Phyllostomus hastatus]